MANTAQKTFGFLGNDWNRPKPKILFWVQFELNDSTKGTIPIDLSYMCKTTDRPQFNQETTVYNQYNKSRVVHGKIKYEPIRMMFYDDVRNSAFKLFTDYRRFYYGDFQNKNPDSWNYDTVSTTFEKDQNWGLSTVNNNDGEASYFFKQINIFEFYQKRFTVYNLIHPKVTQFEMDPRDIQAEAISEITLGLEYEGVTHRSKLVSAPEGIDMIDYPASKELLVAAGLLNPGDPFTPDTAANSTINTVSAKVGSIGQKYIFDKNKAIQAATSVGSSYIPPIPRTPDEAVRTASTIYNNVGNAASTITGKTVKAASSVSPLFAKVFGR